MQLAVYREFGSLAAPQIRYLPEGLTLAELKAQMVCLPADFDSRGVICINGRPVYRKAWGVIRPKAEHNGVPVEITFHAPPMGGGKEGGGKNILAIVAGIALTAITGFVAGGGLASKFGLSAKLFGAGTIGATVAAAGVSLVGSLLLSALVPPPVVPTSGKSINNPGAASAEGNVLEPNGPIPRVLGQRKVFPPLACEPFTYFDGPDEVVEAIYVLNGPHQITDIRVGAAAIDGLTNVEYETREGWPGDLPVGMIGRMARTEVLQSELRSYAVDANGGRTLESPTGDFAAALPQPITVATRDAPNEQLLHLMFPGGLNRNASDTERLRVPLRLRIRQVGSTNWRNLPELHFMAATPRQLRATIKLLWSDSPSSSPSAAANEGWVEARISAPAQVQSPPGDPFSCNATFFGVSGDSWMSSTNLGTTRVKNVVLTRYMATIILDTSVFPRGRYEIEIVRGQQVLNSDWSSSAYTVSGTIWDLFSYAGTPARIAQSRNGISDSAVLMRSVSIWNEHPLPGSGLAVIAVRARNRALEQVSCVAGGYVPDWDGTAWRSWAVTSNPAPHFRDVLAGWQNLDPVPLPIIDDAGLVSWRDACTALGYQVNALIEDATVDDALRIIGACGYAKPYQSEIWGVVRDYDRSAEAPVQIFTPRNSRDFQWTKAFARLPEGFRVNFRDETRDYDNHQITVFRSGVSSDTGRLEQVTYEGLVTEAEVTARAEYDLAQLEQRSTFYTLTAPAEAIICRRGDLVGVQHDAIEVYSGSARVIDIFRDGSGNITALKLDGAVPVRSSATDVLGSPDILAEPDVLALGQKTGAMIRRAGSITVHALAGTTGDTDTLTFAAPISDVGVGIGTLVSVGPLNAEVKRLVVKDIEPGEDLTATIVMVDEAPGIVPDLTP